MKKRYFVLLFILLFLSGFLMLLGNSIPYVNTISEDIKYNFESDVLYSNDTGEFPINETFNLRNSTKYTEHYNGTYSFENEVGLSGTEINFIDIDNSDLSCTSDVISLKDNHKDVLKLRDYKDDGKINITHNFISIQISQTYEFWIQITDYTKTFQLIFFETNTFCLQLRFGLGDFSYYDGGWIDIKDINNNQWYHNKIIWNDDTNTFDWYINNILEKDNGNYGINSITGFTGLNIISHDSEYSQIVYFDAISESWDSDYFINNNLIPYEIINTSIQEIDKFEFAYDINGNLLSIGSDNPNSWNDIESNDNVNIYYDLKQENDRVVKMIYNTIGNIGLEKDFSIEKGIINITLSIEYGDFTDISNRSFYCNVYSYDESLIVKLRFHFISGTYMNLYYWDGTNDIYLISIPYYQYEHTINRKKFNLYINEFCQLIFQYGNNPYEIVQFPLIQNKKGLSNIEFIGNVPDLSELYLLTLDSIGVYINGTSLAIGYCFMTVPIYPEIPGGIWYLYTHNLFTINAKGYFKFDIIGWSGSAGLSAWINHNNTDITVNYYYQNGGKIYNPFLYYLLNETQEFHINSIKIKGCKLTEGNNSYWLEYDYLNVDNQKNYFYVNNSNLYFNVDFDSSDIEYIQATFNIDDKSTTNYAISYIGYYSGYNIPYFCILYTDGNYGYYDIKYYLKKTLYILPQGIFIDKFVLNVSDFNPFLENYTNIDSGFIIGYLTEITLTYFRDLETSIIITTMIIGFIPLLVIFLPTIIIKNRFGNKAVIPMIIIMTFICFVCQLIPTWLFSILLLIYGMILIIKKDDSL